MDVAPRYLGRHSFVARRDPRLLIVCALLYTAGVIQLADWRSVLILTAIALGWYALARIPFRVVRANWLFALGLITFAVLVNSVITGGEQVRGIAGDRELVAVPLLGTPITLASLSYAATLIVRFAGIVAMGFPIAFCVAPGDLGVTVRRLGVPDKFAVGVDLTMRFIPALAHEFQTTIDAQRVRGFDPLRTGRGPIAKLRGLAPIVVPATVGAFANAEDTIDAMELRAFGTGRRTWLRELRFGTVDWLVLGAFAVVFGAATAANLTGTLDSAQLLPGLG